MFKLAFRGVSRYKKRTLITAFAIAIAIIFSIFMQTLITGIRYQSNKNLIWNDTSSAKIYAPGYFDDREYLPIDKLISNEAGKTLEKLLDENNYTNYTKEFDSSGQIMFYEDPFPTSGSLTVNFKAIDSSHSNAYNLNDAKIKGQWISKNIDGVVLGSKLASDIKADIGYYLTVQTKGKDGFIQAFDIPIIGIIGIGDPMIDASTVFFDINTLDDYLELEGSATCYAVSYSMNIAKIKSITDTETIKLKKIAQKANLEAYSWKEIAEEILRFEAADGGFAYIFLFFTFVISIVGISNTMLMSISERKNEIAMLKALGYGNSYIRKLFTLEGTIIGSIGVIIGTVIGLIISFYYQIVGIDFSSFTKDTTSIGYRINTVVHAFISLNDILLIVILGLFFSMLAAYLAVRRTGRGEIAELFRKV
jgi:ABC-type lipoprotein release transport system permease subunit